MPLLTAFALWSGAGCDIPRDPEGTLAEATRETLRVGVTEAPPWVVKPDDRRSTVNPPAEGVEADLVRRFARSIGADIEWIWGSTADHMEALGRHDLHLAIGGYAADDPWAAHVGMTTPYHTERWRVAAPAGAPSPASESDIRGRRVAVPSTGATAARVRERDAHPVRSDDPWRAPGLVAGPVWRLYLLGRDTAGVGLGEIRHVIAVPPGENDFLVTLERSLRNTDVGALLARAARETPSPSPAAREPPR